MYTARSHDRYARAFVHQRVREVFDTLDSKHDEHLDEEELLSHLWSVGYHASKKEVHDMIWEVDDRSTGVITLEAIRKVLKRLQREKKRMPGTGTNLLRTLVEFMMFDSDGSAAIELEEIQQMFYVYYGYKGKELDEKVNYFSRMRSPDKIGGEIDFSEFLNLMDRLGLVPVIGEQEGPKAPRQSCIPKLKSPRRRRKQDGDLSPREQEEEEEKCGGNTPRLPLISPRSPRSPRPKITPRRRLTDRQISEQKFRKISSRFNAEIEVDKKRKAKEDAQRAEEAPSFTIRNALMK